MIELMKAAMVLPNIRVTTLCVHRGWISVLAQISCNTKQSFTFKSCSKR